MRPSTSTIFRNYEQQFDHDTRQLERAVDVLKVWVLQLSPANCRLFASASLYVKILTRTRQKAQKAAKEEEREKARQTIGLPERPFSTKPSPKCSKATGFLAGLYITASNIDYDFA